jgi:quercetin dioxygenase-like cupin family protein
MPSDTLPLPIIPAPDLIDPALEPLLGARFAEAFAATGKGCAADPTPVRGRLLRRLADARAAADAMHTVRCARLAAVEVAPGVRLRTLYAARAGRAPRRGEPERACIVELAPGAAWPGGEPRLQREWLVLHGQVRLGSLALGPRDYHVAPAGSADAAPSAPAGARLFLRESARADGGGQAPSTVRDADAGWPEFAPGVRRRVLWQHDGEAAMLYLARPGAALPTHGHGHDEECLMVRGELFLDDLLLQEGDYQLAPAGTGHRVTKTDTGVVIYAHGDLDLQFVA